MAEWGKRYPVFGDNYPPFSGNRATFRGYLSPGFQVQENNHVAISSSEKTPDILSNVKRNKPIYRVCINPICCLQYGAG